MVTDATFAEAPPISTTEPTLSGPETFVPPYRPSWVNRLVWWLERLPGPAWLTFSVLAMALGALSAVLWWFSGRDAVGVVNPNQLFWGVAMIVVLWLYHYLDGVAAGAVTNFRPALPDQADGSALRYELTVIPGRPALALTVIVAVFTPIYYVWDPVASDIVGLSPFGMAARWVSETIFGSLIVIFIYHALRQLRAVNRVHASTTRIDLFRPNPLYAFSSLTVRTGLIVALVFVVPTLAAPGALVEEGYYIWVPWVVVGVVVGTAVFVLPLRGMERRIVAEKRRLQAEVGQRLEATVAALHAAVDGADLSQADGHNKMLSSLIAERDLVDRLPTWPWRPGTMRGFATLIILPIALFLAQRILLQVFAIGG